MVRCFLAAMAAFRTFFRAALRCFSLGISFPLFIMTFELMAFEILDRSFMCLGLLQRLERAQVAAFARLYILLARVQAVLARFQFTNHGRPYNKLGWHRRRS